MLKVFEKWKIKRLDRNIDRLLLKKYDKIGKMFSHDKLKHNLLATLLVLAFLPALMLITFITLLDVTNSVESSKTDGNNTTDEKSAIDAILNYCNRKIGYLNPTLEAMDRWFHQWNHDDHCYFDDFTMEACYSCLFNENVEGLFKDAKLFTDAEYGRLVKPILAYIKVCLTIDDCDDAELREEFIRKTDLERFLHEMMECKADRKMKLDELKNERERTIKDKALGKIDAVTKTIGMNEPPKEVSESVEIRRLDNVTNELKKTNGQLVTTIKNIEQRI